MKYYKGKYRVKNPSKYVGDISNVIYRSHWEMLAMKWCDENSKVEKWGSEVIVIPYICTTDRKKHRYFTDLYIKFSNGKTLIVEIKPEKQTIEPKSTRGKSKKRFLQECATYSKNTSKWKEADKYCKKRGWTFQIWNEKTLRGLGMKLIT